MQEFVALHPEMVGRPFYITGESYGGHYVPAIAHRIVAGDFGRKENERHLNLQGMAVGNGLVNPELQYPAYAEFALQNGMIGAS